MQFIVNSKGSLAQAGFVLLLLPVISSLKGIAFQNLPSYCMDGEFPLLVPLPIIVLYCRWNNGKKGHTCQQRIRAGTLKTADHN